MGALHQKRSKTRQVDHWHALRPVSGIRTNARCLCRLGKRRRFLFLRTGSTRPVTLEYRVPFFSFQLPPRELHAGMREVLPFGWHLRSHSNVRKEPPFPRINCRNRRYTPSSSHLSFLSSFYRAQDEWTGSALTDKRQPASLIDVTLYARLIGYTKTHSARLLAEMQKCKRQDFAVACVPPLTRVAILLSRIALIAKRANFHGHVRARDIWYRSCDISARVPSWKFGYSLFFLIRRERKLSALYWIKARLSDLTWLEWHAVDLFWNATMQVLARREREREINR